MGLFSGIGKYQAAKATKKGLAESLAYQQAERRKAQQRGEELYGEYTPAGGMGMDALQRQYDVLVGGDISKFQESPGYQFAMEQGVQALERGASARGGLLGGRQMKELTRYGQGMASQEFGNWLTQLQNMTRQATDIGMGGAREIMGQYGGGTPGQIGSTMASLGQAKGIQRQIPWQEAQEQQEMLGEYIGGVRQKRRQESVGAYGPQQPTTKYFGVF
jgi:hypothetical protein